LRLEGGTVTLTGRFFWTLCLWIPPLICFEDFCNGNTVDPAKAWREFDSAFKSKFAKEEE
jgi:hypothetical protein